MNEKASLLEYEIFTVHKAKFVDVEDSSRKRGR
jgi:hypothetical protein